MTRVRFHDDALSELAHEVEYYAKDQAAVPQPVGRLAVPVDVDPALAIGEQEIEQDCDLIVVGKHGRNMIEDLLLGSVTSHVLAESLCDVLVSTSTSRV